MYHERIVNDIREANRDRSPTCIRRRLLKILEELGETSEAYLSKTGTGNYKNKSWDDYREEGVDTMIVMVDVALTELVDSTWPAAALLYLNVEEGRREAVTSFEEMEQVNFDIARAVCSADHFLRQADGTVGFYGATARGVKAAARLAFAKVPRDATLHPEDDEGRLDDNQIAARVYETVTKKLAKWKGRSTAKPMIDEIKMAKPYATAGGEDIKSYMEKFERS